MLSILTIKAHSFLWGVDPLQVIRIEDLSQLMAFSQGKIKCIDWHKLFSSLPESPPHSFKKALLLQPMGEDRWALPVEEIGGFSVIVSANVKEIPLFLQGNETNASLLGLTLIQNTLCFFLDLEKMISKSRHGSENLKLW